MTLSRDQRASLQIEASLRAGDIEGVIEALGTRDVRDAVDPLTANPLLAQAIAWSPPPLVKLLLERGADPNYRAEDGFPSLLAAVDRAADDRAAVMAALIDAGAHLEQRGINDYTPLHLAASRGDQRLVELLLARGANPLTRTRIDDLASPADEAERCGYAEVASILRAAEQSDSSHR